MKQSISHSPEYLSIKSSKNLFSNITHTNLKQQANHIHMNSIQPSILPSSSKHLLNNVHNLCLARALLPGLDNFDSSLEKIDAQIGIWIRAWGWKRGIWHKCSFESKATMETKTRRARDELRCWENECTKEEKGSMRLTTKDTCSSIFNLTFSCILHLLRWILQSSYSVCLLSQQITYLLIKYNLESQPVPNPRVWKLVVLPKLWPTMESDIIFTLYSMLLKDIWVSDFIWHSGTWVNSVKRQLDQGVTGA